ncbi:Protein argonaute [Ciborinia camelliae]|nr:Protein argonaute [Ciborinia camelliae]
MIFEHPAVYYAHLASNRARAHEAQGFSAGPRGGEKFLEKQQAEAAQRVATGMSHPTTSQTGSSNLVQDIPLLPLGTINEAEKVNIDVLIKIRTGMWYI